MRKTLALLLSLPLVGCVVGDGGTNGTGDDGTGDDGTGSGSGSGSGSGPTGGISGHITSNTDWTGTVLISGVTTIDPGVTVTIAAGATVTLKGQASLQIQGILDAQGTSAAKVTLKPEGMGWPGITVAAGGELKFKFVDQAGGSITTSGTGKATIVDSHLHHAAGDFLMMNGGTMDVSYSTVGMEPGQTDTTHCQMHFNPGGNVIKVTHSNISTSSYGLMFYGGMNADFQYNNWFSNTTDVDTQAGSPVSGNFSNGWFEKGGPTGTGITATNLAAARLAACTGANDAMCAGARP
jgi:hypothetical protein